MIEELMYWEAGLATKGLYICWPYPKKLAYIPPLSYLRVIEYVLLFIGPF